MTERTCLHDGALFMPRRADQQYCSRHCKERAHSKRQRERADQVGCSVLDCARKATAPAMKVPLCSMHYRRKRLYGDVGEAAPRRGGRMGVAPCTAPGCTRKYYADGFCAMHYNRRRTTGEVGPAGPLKAANGEGCLATRSGYRYYTYQSGGHTKRIAEHRVVMERMIGRPLHRFECPHHKNGIRHDNRPENLELWTKPQPAGQRPEDLAAWVVEFYPDLVAAELRALI